MLKKRGGLSGNQLKVIALVAMTLDHIGVQILTDCTFLRIVGRLAFPIFAYMIAEGCQNTKNRRKYLGIMALVAFVCQLVYFIALRSLRQCILVTFTLAVGLIYIYDYSKNKSRAKGFLIMALAFTLIYGMNYGLPKALNKTDFSIDYGMYGILMPLFVYVGRNKREKLILCGMVLACLALDTGWIQWFAFAALPLIAIYNGKRGKWKLKYLFYIYYPAHLVVIYLIGMIL